MLKYHWQVTHKACCTHTPSLYSCQLTGPAALTLHHHITANSDGLLHQHITWQVTDRACPLTHHDHVPATLTHHHHIAVISQGLLHQHIIWQLTHSACCTNTPSSHSCYLTGPAAPTYHIPANPQCLLDSHTIIP